GPSTNRKELPSMRFDSIARACRRGALLAVTAALAAAPVFAAEATLTKAEGDAKSATPGGAMDPQMAEMMKMAAPGPQHLALKPIVGKWKVSTKSYMAPGEPTVSEGSCTNSMILGGRFVQQIVKSTMMGMPFEGMGITGYDNMQKMYTFTWLDNMGTQTMSGTGT